MVDLSVAYLLHAQWTYAYCDLRGCSIAKFVWTNNHC